MLNQVQHDEEKAIILAHIAGTGSALTRLGEQSGGRHIRMRAVSGLGAMTAACLLGGCRAGVLDPQGPVAEGERLILFNALAVMLLIVVPVIIATIGFAWWYRASNKRAERRLDWAYSGQLEFIIWAIPALVVLFLGGIAWIGSHDLDPAKPLSAAPPLEVQVVSLDWKWLFIYPGQGVATVNRLVLPVGVPVHFRLTSATVLNNFFVPQLGSQIYTMAGMATQLHLQADKPGIYPGLSAHYSGDGFSGMHFDVHAIAPAAFADWAARVRGHRPPLDTRAYAGLAQESSEVKPIAFGAVQPGLFEAILRQTAPPAQTPQARPNAAVSPRQAP
jgi:cytochrome o ubiquinol oxidase subunit 2